MIIIYQEYNNNYNKLNKINKILKNYLNEKINLKNLNFNKNYMKTCEIENINKLNNENIFNKF